MVSCGAGLRGVTLFRSKNNQDQKKGLRRKISGFSVQMRLDTKQNEKTRSSTQISGVIVSYHMVSHQNDVIRGGPPPHPSDATGDR